MTSFFEKEINNANGAEELHSKYFEKSSFLHVLTLYNTRKAVNGIDFLLKRNKQTRFEVFTDLLIILI